jgi:hypothetical protein
MEKVKPRYCGHIGGWGGDSKEFGRDGRDEWDEWDGLTRPNTVFDYL